MSPSDTPENQNKESALLKAELSGLFQYIQRVRKEIAHISRPADEDHHFETMSEQLDAVIRATDEASDTIMSCAEKNEELATACKQLVSDPTALKVLAQISENHMKIIEACSFQDLTSQRVTKVARSITYVEDRVGALAELWGKNEIDKVEVVGAEKTEDEKLLHGPQDPERAISQAEIDALFD